VGMRSPGTACDQRFARDDVTRRHDDVTRATGFRDRKPCGSGPVIANRILFCQLWRSPF
jgi:hypothetical protein